MGKIVTNATNYNGDLDGYLDIVLSDEADFLGKKGQAGTGVAYQATGVRSKLEIDRMEADEDPFTAYTDDAPDFAALGNSPRKEKRDLAPVKMTLPGTITPSEWLNEWDKYAPTGTLTDLRGNPDLVRRAIDLSMNKGSNQLARLFWQGDKSLLATNPLHYFDGVMTLVEADSDTDITFITPAGNITTANVYTLLTAVYNAMTPSQLEDPDFKIVVSHTTMKIIKLYNLDLKKTTAGILEEENKAIFLGKEVVPYIGFPDNKMFATHINLSVDSNLVYGVYFSLESEVAGLEVGKIANFSKKYGYRVDFMNAVQYRTGSRIIAYLPA